MGEGAGLGEGVGLGTGAEYSLPQRVLETLSTPCGDATWNVLRFTLSVKVPSSRL